MLKESEKPEFSKLILYSISMDEKRLNDSLTSLEKVMVNLTAKTVEFLALEQNLYHV